MYDFEERRLPIGVENFEEICTDEYYYVDKTAMIRDFLRRRGKVNLFTRPRRFGKSLNMSMFKSFFGISGDKAAFDGLAIASETALCENYMGKFPVIFLSLKSVEGMDYPAARSMLCAAIGTESLKFYELLTGGRLTDRDRVLYEQLIEADRSGQEMFVMSDAVLRGSLKTLSALLEKHYGRKAVILIDEYDVPLAKAKEQGYYDQMVSLIRGIFEQGLKTNDSLQFAVLTGCLRVAKESIFTGLNNMRVFSITSDECAAAFGFTDDEVRRMLAYYGLEDRHQVIKEWYDGYHFGDTDVYCPWDVINYVSRLLSKRTLPPQDFWSNTSGNDVIRKFLEQAAQATRNEIERLIAGEAVKKRLDEELTYKELYDNIEHVWSVLFATGYLTQRGEPEGNLHNLVIPNRELHGVFMNQIADMHDRVRTAVTEKE